MSFAIALKLMEKLYLPIGLGFYVDDIQLKFSKSKQLYYTLINVLLAVLCTFFNYLKIISTDKMFDSNVHDLVLSALLLIGSIVPLAMQCVSCCHVYGHLSLLDAMLSFDCVLTDVPNALSPNSLLLHHRYKVAALFGFYLFMLPGMFVWTNGEITGIIIVSFLLLYYQWLVPFMFVLYIRDLSKFLSIWLSSVDECCRTKSKSTDGQRQILDMFDNLWCSKRIFNAVFSWQFLLNFLYDFHFLLTTILAQCLMWRQRSVWYIVYAFFYFALPIVVKDCCLVRSMVELSQKVYNFFCLS